MYRSIHKIKVPHILSVILLTMLLYSCGLNSKYQRQDLAHKDLFRDVDTTVADTNSIADIPWKEVFTDPVLQGLINEGINANLDLKVAVARMKSAEAALMQQRGALLPSVEIDGSATYAKLANTISVASGFATEQYQLYGAASWELDIWGKLRSSKRGALADLLASDAYRRTVQTQLIATISTNYYALLALDQQLKITEETVESRKKYVQTVESLIDVGSVTGADLMQSKANRYAAEVTIPELKQQIREIENAMSTLLARSPGTIERSTLDDQQLEMELETGVPSLLLANRPDVQQAEMQLRSAFEAVNVARAYFYPQISLSGSVGYASTDASVLLDPANFFSRLAAGLVQPLFNQNTNRARLKANKAAQEEALYTFEQTFLSAGEEVSNALFSYEMALEKIDLRKEQLAALENAVDYNEELLEYSTASYVDVLTSQQNLLSAQLNAIDDRLQKLQAVVELYRALGGGWKE